MVDIEPLIEDEDLATVYELMQKHVKYTGSAKARKVLQAWDQMAPRFVKIFPTGLSAGLGGAEGKCGTKSWN